MKRNTIFYGLILQNVFLKRMKNGLLDEQKERHINVKENIFN